MSSSVYDIINSFIQCSDLQYFGQQLINFANAVYKEKNRATIIKHFYEQLNPWAFHKFTSNDFFDEEKCKYYICEENNAVRLYVGLTIPAESTTVKTINEIKTYGEYLLTSFKKPVGECISEESLEDILQYLDKKYDFFTKVFSNKKIAFIRVPNTNVEFNSVCLTAGNKDDLINHFFLYHMKEKDSISPEKVLFHELGHAIHAQRFGDLSKVPDNIIDYLQALCFPTLKQLDTAKQSEIFADVLSLGLMYQSPYDSDDLYKEINSVHKKEFKTLVEKLIEL